MSCKAVKVVVRPSPPVKVVVEKKVQLPPVRVQVPGIQGAKGDKGEAASFSVAKSDEIDLLFGESQNGWLMLPVLSISLAFVTITVRPKASLQPASKSQVLPSRSRASRARLSVRSRSRRRNTLSLLRRSTAS